jgi:hypothetical protein
MASAAEALSAQNQLVPEERQSASGLKKVSMNLAPEDLVRADILVSKIGRTSNRTEVLRRALHLLYWAFVKKEADELIVIRKGKEVGRIKWADSLPL